MEEKIPKITEEGIDTIIEYLSIFEEPSFASGEWIKQQGHFSVYNFSSKVDSFVSALCEHGFIFDFDWPSWQSEAMKFFEDPSLIANADIVTIQKLFTTHIRKDRFCEGHLADVIESGHIKLILRRLKQIRLDRES